MTAHWKTLSHSGVAIPDPYIPGGLSVRVRGREVRLSPLAEEMAYHFARKKETPYVKDSVFIANFMHDFLKLLPSWCRDARFEQVDLSLLHERVEMEKRERESMSKEMKKASTAERKLRREALKSRYGIASVDGKKVEIANWLVEPPGLFMGRGAHPLRGHWKPRVTQRDVILNLDEEGAVPPGEWKQVVNDHNSMWVAKWIDKLTGKEKYVWLHDSAPLQQSRNKAKYDSAMKVGIHIERIRRRILRDLSSKDPKLRKIATVCYLIDTLGMRVGDEKDEDEADTVGATTLRAEHIKLNGSSFELDFLGKDSVPWSKVVETAPTLVVRNIRAFMAGKKPDQKVFDGIDSNDVNRFLSKILSGLTAKAFRTHHATLVAASFLKSREVREKGDVEKLYQAKLANLEAAKFCNHQRTIPKNWEESLAKKKEKLKELQSRERRDERRIRKMAREIDLQVKTKNYNLNTALKNYIDPRLYKSWCDYAGVDWTKIYTKSMQRKFAWVAKSKAKWEQEEPRPIEVVARSN